MSNNSPRGARFALPASIVIAATMLATAAFVPPAAAQDFHATFHDRCQACHEHSGAFARERMEIVEGMLRSRASGREIEPFLRTHAGGMDAEMAALFVANFIAQLRSGGLYEKNCIICHDRARELVRTFLTVRDGRLVGRYSGLDIETFLISHGRLDAAERYTVYLRLLDLAGQPQGTE